MYSRYHKNYDIHYVIIQTIKNQKHWIHVFDYHNLMLYLLDSKINLTDKEIFYYDSIYRNLKNHVIHTNGEHKLNKTKLLKQAYQYENINLTKETYNNWLEIWEKPNRNYQDCYHKLKIDSSQWIYNPHYGYSLSHYHQQRKPHRTSSFGIPKHMWKKIKNEYYLATIDDTYENNYAQYFTHKNRYKKSQALGWWDDYTRRQKSTGWKESTKRKHQYK